MSKEHRCFGPFICEGCADYGRQEALREVRDDLIERHKKNGIYEQVVTFELLKWFETGGKFEVRDE